MPLFNPFTIFSDSPFTIAQKQYYSIQRQSYMKNIILKTNTLLIKYYTTVLYLDLSEGCFTILLWKQLREGIAIWGAEFMLYHSCYISRSNISNILKTSISSYCLFREPGGFKAPSLILSFYLYSREIKAHHWGYSHSPAIHAQWESPSSSYSRVIRTRNFKFKGIHFRKRILNHI